MGCGLCTWCFYPAGAFTMWQSLLPLWGVTHCSSTEKTACYSPDPQIGKLVSIITLSHRLHVACVAVCLHAGAAVAGVDPDGGAELHHPVHSDHEPSEVITSDDPQPPPPAGSTAAIGIAAAGPDGMQVDGSTGLLGAHAPVAAAAAAANGGDDDDDDAVLDDKSDPVLLPTPPDNDAAYGWAEALGTSFGSAAPGWQAQQQQSMQLPCGHVSASTQQQQEQQEHVVAYNPSVIAADAAAAGAGAGATTNSQGARHSRVERLYSSKRSWVTQQLEGLCCSDLLVAAQCDSANTGTMQDHMEQPQQQQQNGHQQQHLGGCSVPGAAGPCASDGGGFPGLFHAPTGCLDAAGTNSARAASASREMHTCLHSCDSNRFGGSSSQVAPPGCADDAMQHTAAAAGSKRKSHPGAAGDAHVELSSAVTPAAGLSRACLAPEASSLHSRQVLVSQAAAQAATGSSTVAQQVAGVSAIAGAPTSTALQASTAAQQVGPVVGPASNAAAASEGGPAAAPALDHDVEGAADGHEDNKRRKLDTWNAAALPAEGASAEAPAAAAAVAPVTSTDVQAGVQPGDGAGVAVGSGCGQQARLAPAPLDSAAAAAQMPPPAAHPRPQPVAAEGAAALAAALPDQGGLPAALAALPAMSSSAQLTAASACAMTTTSMQAATAMELFLQQARQQQQQQHLLLQPQFQQLVTAAQQLPLALGLPGLAPAAAGLQLPAGAAPSQQHLGLAGLLAAAAANTPAGHRPWGVPSMAAAVAAARAAPPPPLALPGGLLPAAALSPLAAALSPHHVGLNPVMMAALNGAGAVLFGPAAGAVGYRPVGEGGGGAAAGRRHQAPGSEQADSCLP